MVHLRTRFVEWAEAEGLEFDFAVSATGSRSRLAAGYDVGLGVGHDESGRWAAGRTRAAHRTWW